MELMGVFHLKNKYVYNSSLLPMSLGAIIQKRKKKGVGGIASPYSEPPLLCVPQNQLQVGNSCNKLDIPLMGQSRRGWKV